MRPDVMEGYSFATQSLPLVKVKRMAIVSYDMVTSELMFEGAGSPSFYEESLAMGGLHSCLMPQ